MVRTWVSPTFTVQERGCGQVDGLPFRMTFHYWLRAFHGPASAPVEVSLPAGELTPED
ncbi:hypothetical protein [Streptomyces sp. NPDC056244]|uniref:hypothetical protein n=1 Tax=Streptomyces sp. NPDC056244 TaxID=3345762 RepID=UPI0035DCC08C